MLADPENQRFDNSLNAEPRQGAESNMKIKSILQTGVMTALIAVGATLALAPTASAATQVGTPNLTRYCQQNVGQVWYAKTYSLTNPYNWNCTNSYTNGMVRIDVNKACRQQFGAGAYANTVSSNPNGWRCFK